MSTATGRVRASFVIYKDEPSPPTRASQAAGASGTPDASAAESSTSNTAEGRLTIPTIRDKENVDPVTGRRPSIEDQLAKKRKTGILAAKILSCASKLQKEVVHEPKKRKVETKHGAEKKERRALGTKRTLAPIRTKPELPRVDEVEHDESQVAAEGACAAQATVDSRCYELTVTPLADVSEAYDHKGVMVEKAAQTSPPADEKTKSDKEEDATSTQEASEARDTQPTTTDTTTATAAALSEDPPLSPTLGMQNLSLFSTPERKRIYSAFTFTSPSPSGQRYAVIRGTNVLDKFSDIAFDLGL